MTSEAPKRLKMSVSELSSGHNKSPNYDTSSIERKLKSVRNSSSPKSMKRSNNQLNINRGVGHKIRRPRSENARSTYSIDSILEKIQNEKLRQRIITKREEKQQIEKIYNIMRSCKNPIELAKPLQALCMVDVAPKNNIDNQKANVGHTHDHDHTQIFDFSDDSFSDQNLSEKDEHNFMKNSYNSAPRQALNELENKANKTENQNRKFFKSGIASNISKEITITDRIKANVCNGKILLMSPKRIKFKTQSNELAATKTEVNAIIKNLDTIVDSIKVIDNIETFDKQPPKDYTNQTITLKNNEVNLQSVGKIRSEGSVTTQSRFTLRQNQHINSNLECGVLAANSVDLIKQQKLFPIFYTDTGQCKPSMKRSLRRNRIWQGGFGQDQYQIDAGQKKFGAKQCEGCGLVYVLHEPEEEELHRDYHSTIHVLRFKGWIDEDRVATYAEWGRDGRIIRITESSHPKRKERLSEILKIVDKELGFSSIFVIPATFVAYLAVRHCQIVGICLVLPLNTANKYICFEGIDCCTNEKFEAKCGISRIWVSPLHRRIGIARKLLQAVQNFTILGETILLNKIAFSAPTKDGIQFAKKITQSDEFLIYIRDRH